MDKMTLASMATSRHKWVADRSLRSRIRDGDSKLSQEELVLHE